MIAVKRPEASSAAARVALTAKKLKVNVLSMVLSPVEQRIGVSRYPSQKRTPVAQVCKYIDTAVPIHLILLDKVLQRGLVAFLL